jgi:3-hydroxymyristoyl/3-hydroxydecanoyl-(acyl carrier protein) dehydratase
MKSDDDDIGALLRHMRRAPLHASGSGQRIDAGPDVVKRILPHREPFLFVDRIVEFDAEHRTMLAERRVDPDDPVFVGHFPGAPVYPACLQIEAAGQSALLLWSYAENHGEPSDFGLRVARIEQAIYLHPVLPGDTMQLSSRLIHCDDLCLKAAAQVHVEGKLCSAILLTAVLVDD